MSEPSPDALARKCADAMYERDHAARALDIRIEDVRAGYSKLSMEIGPAMINGHDIAHGGYVFTLADTAFAYGCNSFNERNVALQCSISFSAPAMLGKRYTAEAVLRTRSNRISVYDIEITDPDGATIALFRGTSYKISGTVIEGR